MSDALKLEIHRLAGETLALQTMLFWLLFHVERGNAQPISKAFDDAANSVEERAIALGNKASPEHVTKALQIIEQFRDAIIKDKPTPRGGV